MEISSAVYKKKFGGRIDVIIGNLKFSEKNQAFYISWYIFILYKESLVHMYEKELNNNKFKEFKEFVWIDSS